MTKAPIELQDLRRRIYRKAKSDKTHRFWGFFAHIAKMQTLEEAYRIAKRNGGAPASMARSFRTSSRRGGRFLGGDAGRPTHRQIRTQKEPRGGDTERQWQSPNTSDSLYSRPRGARGAEANLEAIFEADFCPNSYAFGARRPRSIGKGRRATRSGSRDRRGTVPARCRACALRRATRRAPLPRRRSRQSVGRARPRRRVGEYLRELKAAEAELARREHTRPLTLTPEDRAAVVALGKDLDAVWSAPTTTDRDRKELLRTLLEEVVMGSSARNLTRTSRCAGAAFC